MQSPAPKLAQFHALHEACGSIVDIKPGRGQRAKTDTTRFSRGALRVVRHPVRHLTLRRSRSGSAPMPVPCPLRQ